MNMSKSKIIGMMALIAFAMGIFLVGDALAGERGKVVAREVYYATTIHTLKVPDVEGHAILMIEAKGIGFNEKWGAYLIYLTSTLDLIKREGTRVGYNQYTFPDGSTMIEKWEGKGGALGEAEGTWAYTKGTGRLEGIQAEGTWKSHNMGPGQWYSDGEGEYTLP
jgi:hypothetical protein